MYNTLEKIMCFKLLSPILVTVYVLVGVFLLRVCRGEIGTRTLPVYCVQEETCEEILDREQEPCIVDDVCNSVTEDNDPTVLSVIGSIDTTSSAQPIVNVTRNVSAEYDVGNLLSDKSGYIFGFRDCTSNTSKVCYIMENMPVDTEPTHKIFPKLNNSDDIIPGGDQCTFFGCYRYCEIDYTQDTCTRVHGHFFEANETILGNCPNPGNTTMNGDVNIYTTYPLTQDGHYIENTTIKVTCYDGYSVSDGGESICLSNGNWSASSSNGIPICTVGSCPNPGNTTMNGDVNIYTTYPLTQDGHYIENTTIKVTCYDGYSVSDGGESICLSNGNWSASSSNGIPICTERKRDLTALTALAVALPLALILAVSVMAITILYILHRYYQNYKKRRFFSVIFKAEAHREVLNPNYTPVDVRPHKFFSISLSIKTIEEYPFQPPPTTLETPLTDGNDKHKMVKKSSSLTNISNGFSSPLFETNTPEIATTVMDKASKSYPSLTEQLAAEDPITLPAESKEDLDIPPLIMDCVSGHPEVAAAYSSDGYIEETTRGDRSTGEGSSTNTTEAPQSEHTTASIDSTATFGLTYYVTESSTSGKYANTLEMNAHHYPTVQDSSVANSVEPLLSPVDTQSVPCTPSDVTMAFEKVDNAMIERASEPITHIEVWNRDQDDEKNDSYITDYSGDEFLDESKDNNLNINRPDNSTGVYLDSVHKNGYISETDTHYVGSSTLGSVSCGGYIDSPSIDGTSSSMGQSSTGYVLESEINNQSRQPHEPDPADHVTNHFLSKQPQGQMFDDNYYTPTSSSAYIQENLPHSNHYHHDNSSDILNTLTPPTNASLRRSTTPELRPLETGYVAIIN